MKACYLNQDVRRAIEESGLRYYQVAYALNIAQSTFTNWMQSELPPEKKELIFEVIKKGSVPTAEEMNQEVRAEMEEKGIRAYEIANAMKVRPNTFAHWMQAELSPDKKRRVLRAIASIVES